MQSEAQLTQKQKPSTPKARAKENTQREVKLGSVKISNSRMLERKN
jgi:hypothetical protein